MNDWKWQTHRRIASDMNEARLILDQLAFALENQGWPHRDIFGVQLAAEEALVNAIEHGNGSDPTKLVTVLAQAAPHEIHLEITDEGVGFNPASVRDCTSEEAIDEPHGRGLLLMRSYMTSVEYRGCGNCLVMKKTRAA